MQVFGHLGLVRPAEGGFHLDEHPQLVAGIEKGLIGGIVRGTDVVDIAPTEEFDIFPPDIAGQRPSAQGHDLVAADSAQLDGMAVDERLVLPYLDLSETDAARGGLHYGSLPLQPAGQGVEVRMLRIPLAGTAHVRAEAELNGLSRR